MAVPPTVTVRNIETPMGAIPAAFGESTGPVFTATGPDGRREIGAPGTAGTRGGESE